MQIIDCRNVNYALPLAMGMIKTTGVPISPRGQATLECPESVCATYRNPLERVLFNPVRDANPYFHLFESLWIIGGREDVKFPSYFNSGLKQYSDNGTSYHGAYGYRLRKNLLIDQFDIAVKMLKEDPDTRRCVLQIWDGSIDLGADSKDIPCNDMIFLKLRNNKLNISVANRSNDAIWGALGANVVQFSMIQEYLAARIGCEVGIYNQISDSYHVYTENPLWDKLKDLRATENCPYTANHVKPYPLVNEHETFDDDLRDFLSGNINHDRWDNTFFPEVAIPMYKSWRGHKEQKNGWIYLDQIRATDWQLACKEWLERRGDHA